MTSVSNAAERRPRAAAAAAAAKAAKAKAARVARTKCAQVDGQAAPGGQDTTATRQNGRTVRNHWGDGQEKPSSCGTSDGNNGGNNNGGNNNDNDDPAAEDPPAEDNPDQINEDDILADNCEGDSNLEPHDGFQNGNRCVDTEMGEVGNEGQNPSLLITDAPESVGVNEPFQIRVSTRNLIRDRFLAAGQGGYYVEMSKLNEQGLVRGHFHTACRILGNENEAPDPAPAPAFFVATEDGGGSAQPDEIVIEVPGLPEAGVAQCASWAGDGSHRLPMMQRANQTPAFDAVRVEVGGAANDNGNDGANNDGADDNADAGNNNAGNNNNGGNNNGGNNRNNNN